MDNLSQGVDLEKLNSLKLTLQQLGESRKKTKSDAEEIEKKAIELLMQHGIRYVDASNNGSGPFWTLVKTRSEGTFNADRAEKFYELILANISNNSTLTAKQIVAHQHIYMKQFCKRSLGLSKLVQCPGKSITDLKEFMEGKD
jgi:hypothetical protein